MKVVKYILGVLFILGGIGALTSGAFGSGLLLLILGVIFLPPISDLLKEKFKFWQNKAIRYVSYIVLFGIGSILTSATNSISGNTSNSVSHKKEKEDVSKSPYQLYLKESEKRIEKLTDEQKEFREKKLKELRENSVYKDLVDNKTVSAEYIPVIDIISLGLSYMKTDVYEMPEEYMNKIKQSANGEDKINFAIVSVAFAFPHIGGFPKELVDVFDRYRKKYKYYGESSVVLDPNGNPMNEIEPYDFAPIFGVLNPNDKDVLNAIYEAKQKRISYWIEEGDYLYSYLANRKDYNNYLKRVYSKSPYFVDVDIEVSAQQLYADYEANEVAADKKYKGKKLAVTGIIGDIGTDILNKPYVSLEIGYLESVNCYFSNKYNEDIANLHKGQRINITGVCRGKSMGIMITLDKCKILE